jgi:hypothetical protein
MIGLRASRPREATIMKTRQKTRLALRTDIAESVAHVCEEVAELLEPRRVRLVQTSIGDAWCEIEAGPFETLFRELLTEAIRWCDYSEHVMVRTEGGVDTVKVDVTTPSPGPHVTHLQRRFEAIGTRLRIYIYLGRSTTFRVIVPRRPEAAREGPLE